MRPHNVAPELLRLPLVGSDLVNAYLAGDVLIDAGGVFAWKKVIAALQGRPVAAHALTHAHFDHQGSSRRVCQILGIPLWCGDGDREAMESGDLTRILPKPRGILATVHRILAGPGHPVDRALREGDEVGGFTVVETPGHTPGHLAYWRETDGVLILGDVLFHKNPVTLRSGLQEPFLWATVDPEANRASARKLAALKPKILCFGHGPPLTDGRRFQEYVAKL